ncbi:hypothetical protein JCM5353_006035 [Sporobolomyces roseus]
MSFSSLPQELVDQIAFCIGVSGQGRDKVPFGVEPYKADSLLGALEANGCALGRLVHGTSGIDDWIYTTGDRARIRRWYCGVLSACLNLRQVDLHFASQAELEDLLQILSLPDPSITHSPASQPTLPFSTPLSRLRRLDFNDRHWQRQQEHQAHISDVFTTFGRFEFSSLDTVNFTRSYWSKQGNDSTPLYPFAIKHLHIKTREGLLADSIALSSRFPPSLDTFTLDGYSNGGTIDLTQCTTHHGSHLRELGLKFNDY